MSDISVNKNTYTFTWLIEDFDLFSTLNYFDDEIRSPLFTTDHIGQASWFLTIRRTNVSKGIFKYPCSLERYSKDKGSDIIRINWQLIVTSKDNIYVSENNKDVVEITDFKKGSSCIGCDIRKSGLQEAVKLITLQCRLLDVSLEEMPVSKSSIVQSKISMISWYPQNISEIKSFSGIQNTQYELYFQGEFPAMYVKIFRLDSNISITSYVFCGLRINNFTINNQDTKFRFLNPFKINDTCTVSVLLPRSYFHKSRSSIRAFFINGAAISSVVVEDRCSTLARKRSNFNEMVSTLKFDAADLLKDILRIYEDKKHTDVQLKIGNELFPAHKCFLSARSPVFSAMFDHDMIENQTGVINISDMDVSTMKLFLQYIYMNTIEELHCENALKLLTAAEKYQIHSLKEKCAAYLLDNLSEENICEILVVADMISYSEVKNKAMNFVKNNIKKVLLSDSWKQLAIENAKLVGEALIMISEEYGVAKQK